MTEKKNDLVGEWVELNEQHYLAGTLTLGQVLNHPVTDEGYYISSEHWGLRFPRESFKVVDAPEFPPRSAYPEWHDLVGGDGIPPTDYYGPFFEEEDE